MTKREKLRLPLIVGVSGHIDIADDEASVAEKINNFWRNLRRLAGGNTPFVLLSSAAGGADHLAIKYCPSDVKYCVVLPFDEREYEKDFTTSEALADFRKDLAGAFKIIRCDTVPGDYTAASDYVRDHSDVILSFWDGYESTDIQGKAKQGGTYYQIRTAFKADDILEPHCEKLHLMVNLKVQRNSEHNDSEREVLSGDWPLCVLEYDASDSLFIGKNFETFEFKKNLKNDISQVFARLNEHNLNNFENISGNYLYGILNPDDHDGSIDILRRNAALQSDEYRLVEREFALYEYFDSVASAHQSSHKNEFLWIAVISVIAGIAGQAWGDLTFSSDEVLSEWILHGVILLYLAGCFFAWLFYRAVKKRNHYNKYIQPRVIAELMRLKMFWKLGGVKGDFFSWILRDSADFYFAVPVCNIDFTTPDLTFEQQEVQKREAMENFPIVRTAWLKDQESYYNGYLLEEPEKFVRMQAGEDQENRRFLSCGWIRNYFRKYDRINGYFSLLKNIFFWGGFSAAVVLLCIFALSEQGIITESHKDFLSLAYFREFIVGICPFIVSTIGWLLEKNKWNDLASQYRRMRDIFRRADKFFSSPGNIEQKRQLIAELMRVCHNENAEWNSLKNESEPEPML